MQKDILATHLQCYSQRTWANTFSVYQVLPIQGISSFGQTLKIFMCMWKGQLHHLCISPLQLPSPLEKPGKTSSSFSHLLSYLSQIFDTKALQAWNSPISSSPRSSLKSRGNPHAEPGPPLCRVVTLLQVAMKIMMTRGPIRAGKVGCLCRASPHTHISILLQPKSCVCCTISYWSWAGWVMFAAKHLVMF